MKSMKMTAAETKEAMPSPAKMDAPQYPYGLRLELSAEVLEKLGITLPGVGDELEIKAIGKVVSAHASESEGGHKHASCSVQITDMDVEGESSIKSITGRLYKKKEA